jgi:hypothetical protein
MGVIGIVKRKMQRIKVSAMLALFIKVHLHAASAGVYTVVIV